MAETRGNLMHNIGLISRCATLYRDARLEHLGISGYQASYVTQICRCPGISQDQLAQKLHVNRSSVTRQLAMLEENGFITRCRSDSDRRLMQVYPTEKMKQALPVVRECFHSWHDSLTEGLSEDEISTLERLLTRLAERAEGLQ